MKVLIVDDTTFMRRTIRRILEEQNQHEIYEAEDGLEALTKYKIIRPNLVIMDISMPVMDGIEAVKLIKVFDSQANIIICSLQGQKANVMEAIKAGARSFLVKPIKPEKLLAEIVKLPMDFSKIHTNDSQGKDLLNKGDNVQEGYSIEETDETIAERLSALKMMTDSAEDENRSEDYLKGVEAGYVEARREIAINMVRIGIDVNLIMKCVELSEEELDDFKIEYKLGF